jgi:aminopeptidase N
VRDFNFAASPIYTVTRARWKGIDIQFYTTTHPVDLLRKWTLAALKRFSAELGKYPYKQLSVAEMPAGTGMESPQMTWISSTRSLSDVRYLAVHEVAHQWFYGVVGDNQQLQPFMDEGVSDFLARDLLDAFRKSHCANDRLDGSVYDYDAHCYDEVVYVQGADYLDAYRDKVGNRDFWNGMRAFYRSHEFRIGGIRGLLDSLDEASGFNSQRHAKRFPTLYP